MLPQRELQNTVNISFRGRQSSAKAKLHWIRDLILCFASWEFAININHWHGNNDQIGHSPLQTIFLTHLLKMSQCLLTARNNKRCKKPLSVTYKASFYLLFCQVCYETWMLNIWGSQPFHVTTSIISWSLHGKLWFWPYCIAYKYCISCMYIFSEIFHSTVKISSKNRERVRLGVRGDLLIH